MCGGEVIIREKMRLKLQQVSKPANISFV